MNLHPELRKAEVTSEKNPRLKKLVVRLTVNDTNLSQRIKEAFALAKSSGRELDLAFLRQPACLVPVDTPGALARTQLH